jgi:hypothetical protein
MVVQEKARVKDRGKSTEKSNVNDIVRTITDMLWSYDSVRKCVNNNYVVLQSVVRNVVKSLGINANNFDVQSLMDNFDIHMLDLKSQDTLSYSLSELLSRFIVNKVDNNVDIAMEKAPYEIESRLREILNYLKGNPNDSETVDYAKELIQELKEFNRDLARRYESELSTILNPKPVEPKAMVIERPKAEQPKPVNEPKAKVKVISAQERESKAMAIERLLREYLIYIRAPHVGKYDSTPIFVEKAKELIEKLKQYDIGLARYYERELNSILYYKQKYANRGGKRESRVRIKRASAKITEYFNANESESESDKREWKRHVKGILKWIMVIGII